ncbi:MAG TPA: amidohydrolase [Gemmataceae bacterium]|nr:amidohydrolase [Gemmataceae bacterium]
MTRTFLALVSTLAIAAVALAAPPPKLADRIAAVEKIAVPDLPRLVALYRRLHANPELGLEEIQTSARLAHEMTELGLDVTPKVGGTGVVGILRNGPGRVVLIRADMDALPIVEKTDLPYASKVRVRNSRGEEVGVMHACGHDVNMTCLVGVARVLGRMKDRWQGTIVFIGQPAEEIGAGARMMLADGLFTRFPRPDICLALHCDARYPTGTVNFRAGPMQANVDSIDITVKGRGGHGSAPQTTIDPIVLASRIVLDLQTIVSREIDPQSPAVVTVGSMHGGTVRNVIPSSVALQITVRTLTDAVRKQVLEAIVRKTKAAATGAGAPEPEIRIDYENFFPALVNDEKLTMETVAMFREALGKDRVHERGMSMGGEDFARYVQAGVPGFYWHLGSAAPERVAESLRPGGRPLDLTHSAGYWPVPEPTIRTGVLSMSLAVLRLLGK